MTYPVDFSAPSASFAFSFDPQEAPGTPVRSSKKTPLDPPSGTPEQLRRAIHQVAQGGALFYSPDRAGKQDVREGLQTLGQLPTPERRTRARHLFAHVMEELIPDEAARGDPASPQFHEAACQRLEEEGGFSTTGRTVLSVAAKALGGSPPRVVALPHLTTLEKTGGYHVHDPASGVPIRVLATNPETGVQFALVDGRKPSTLFPPGTDLTRVLHLATTSRTIARHNNRCLQASTAGYPVELYTRDHVLVASCFPPFFYGSFRPDSSYQLTESVAISADDVLQAARDPRSVLSYLVPPSEGNAGSAILDVGPALEDRTAVPKGILFKFDSSVCPDLVSEIASTKVIGK